LLFSLVGVGFGLCETCINTLAFELSGGKEGLALNLLHLFPALGAIAGPYYANAMIGRGWAAPFVAIGGLTFLFGAWLLVARFPPPARPRAAGEGESALSLARHPVVLALGAA